MLLGRALKTTLTIALLLTLALPLAGRLYAAPADNRSPAERNWQGAESWRDIFPTASHLGEKDASLGVWPVFRGAAPLGYLFESSDFVAIPGFSGEPVNLLVGLDVRGRFSGVKLLKHHEPIFLHGLGEAPLLEFIRQYAGLSATDNIKVGRQRAGANAYIDGITKATASVVAINETILLSALKVARETLEGFEPHSVAQVRTDIFSPMSWDEMIAEGYIRRLTLSRAQVAEAFDDTPVAGLGPASARARTEPFIDLYYTYLNVPTVGLNLLGAEDYQRMLEELGPGTHAVAVLSNGLASFIDEDFVPGSVPDRLVVKQQDLPIEIRDMNFYDYDEVHSPYFGGFDSSKIFRIKAQSDFDPAAPWQLSLIVSRSKGRLFETVNQRFSSGYHLPDKFFFYDEHAEATPERDAPWLVIWKNRLWEVAILLTSLAMLTAIFVFQHRITRYPKLFHRLRWGFLWFTLVFIGWYAQGQLSVVNIFTIFQAMLGGFRLSDYLIDPILFILWLYVFVSLFVLGRGLYCGWLCPFGALQEMAAWLAKKLRIPQLKITFRTHTRLWRAKYVVLILLLGTSLYSLTAAEILSEVEPFKTAITLVFIRSWPFVLYAVALLVLSLFVHKAYCRYLCPLGAGLAMLGWLHRFEWLQRRAECGSPCQLCKHKCEIGAITPAGKIDYNECIQCLECIVYYHNDDLCPPLINAKKQRRRQVGDMQRITAIEPFENG
ncbi:4Fe-4S binding protein [Porticoccus sp.]